MNAIPTAAAPTKPAHTPGPLVVDGGAASELLDALERLAIFHQPTHPFHGDLHEGYAEDCIANEISYSSATLLDSLVCAANAAIAKATGGAA